MSTRKPPEFDGHPSAFPEVMTFRAVVKRIVDGDTYDFLIDMGLSKYSFETIRLKDFDTPEITRPKDIAEYFSGMEAKHFVLKLLTLNRPVMLTTYRDTRTFERYVADVLIHEEGEWVSIADKLFKAGHAKRTT